MMNKTLYFADWILPITSPPIQNGAILVHEGQLLDVGRYSDIKQKWNSVKEEQKSTLLLPGLVNCHSHLEYACLKEKLSPTENFSDWLIQMIREKKEINEQDMLQGITQGAQEMIRSGTSLVADICNTLLSPKTLFNSQLKIHYFLEILETQDPSMKLEERFNLFLKECSSKDRSSVCPHTAFTVSFDLIQRLSQFIKNAQMLSSIHLCESQEETNWIKYKKGSFEKIFQASSLYNNPCFGKNMSSTQYLKKAHALSFQMICAHGVRLEEEDIKILKESECTIALCPRSNAFTGAGKAPIHSFLKHKIRLALGTDSLASNEDLNMFHEMRYLKKVFPFLDYSFIISLATHQGAIALRWDREYGSLEKGKKSPFIAIHADNTQITDPEAFLVEETMPQMIQIIN